MKNVILVFRREEWLVRTTTVPEILDQTAPIRVKTPIFKHSSR